eukprot:m.171906 g.171906  ORF g.171906 m.171906 type:complete len:57 (-) comp13500_c1_seq16:1483-1653(-)
MATAKSSVLQLSSSFQKHVHQQQVPGKYTHTLSHISTLVHSFSVFAVTLFVFWFAR